MFCKIKFLVKNNTFYFFSLNKKKHFFFNLFASSAREPYKKCKALAYTGNTLNL